ncbi:hypothetical protein HNV08_08310 [Winogradskyella eckloniae]|uniref:hypothetical protein n=1 Tax=Winogradskyella eckloniae TaxID=1089306 RepID=UPI00156393E5|nr:hypothetical protein [Winogradskyella eckloniae]NRD20049.1 hypothetical protein [Winogradskyella eckloniae]
MKNLIIILVIVALSCKDKIVSNDAKTAEIVEGAEATKSQEAQEHLIAIVNNSESDTNEISNATSDVLRSELFKGTLNGNIKISLYLKEQEHPCGGDLTILNAMYKYNNQDQWILLDVTADKQKKNYCMVEDGFLGVLFLQNNEGSLYGHWVSPDTEKQFKVELENQFLDTKYGKDDTIVEELDEILFDILIYGKNDC